MCMLYVFYGENKRWNQDELDRVQAIVGKQCIFFDALQANFEFDNQDQTYEAMLQLRNKGINAQTKDFGTGPSKQAIDKEKQVMRATYNKYKKTQ